MMWHTENHKNMTVFGIQRLRWKFRKFSALQNPCCVGRQPTQNKNKQPSLPQPPPPTKIIIKEKPHTIH